MKNTRRGLFAAFAVLVLISAGCASGPKMEAPPPAPAPAPAPAPSYVIEGVNFATDSARIKPSAQARLNEAAAGLRAQPDVAYEVNGHTDSVGDADYNQGLSERRAESVRNYLIQQGVPSSQLMARGFGETSPIASNDTADGRAQNRRVEIRPRQ